MRMLTRTLTKDQLVMSSFIASVVVVPAALALISLGGALYEFSVVDPFWPHRPDIIQPGRGGISRRRFWIAAHTAFELALLVTLASAWSLPNVRFWLLVALASHLVMRIWSLMDFVPKALAFERAEPASIDAAAARAWTRRSRLRLPLDLVTCFAMLSAFAAAVLAS
jgi:hypothetical protein